MADVTRLFTSACGVSICTYKAQAVADSEGEVGCLKVYRYTVIHRLAHRDWTEHIPPVDLYNCVIF